MIRQITPEKAAKVLWVASEKNDFSVIEKLLNKKLRGDLKQVTDTLVLIPRELCLNILWLASANGNGSVIELILDVLDCEDMSASDSRGLSVSTFWPNAMTIAAENGHRHCLEYFMARGPEIFARNGVKAAYCAARAGKLECLEFLVDMGYMASGDFSVISPASAAGHVDCVRYLLQKRININQVDNCALSPAPALLLAAEGGHVECVSLLLDGGADDRVQRPKDGSVALHTAVMGGHTSIVRLLLGRGTDPDVAMGGGLCGTALYLAATEGRDDCMSCLLEAGADPNRPVKYFGGDISVTPLHAAAVGGHAECVKLLLLWGAFTNFSVDGHTPLQHARAKNHVQCVRLLESPPAVVNSSSRS